MNLIRLVLVIGLIVGSVNAVVGAIGSVQSAQASKMQMIEDMSK